jgi:hypothetical protein
MNRERRDAGGDGGDLSDLCGKVIVDVNCCPERLSKVANHLCLPDSRSVFRMPERMVPGASHVLRAPLSLLG